MVLCELCAGRTGASQDINHGVGCVLAKSIGQFVENGEKLLEFDSEYEISENFLESIRSAVIISDKVPENKSRIIEIIS